MSVSIPKRKLACRQFIKNDFDMDTTVDWFLKEFATDPHVSRVKNKRRLAENIVSMGGSGDQKGMNIEAFLQALVQHQSEWRDEEIRVAEVKLQQANKIIGEQQETINDLNSEVRDALNAKADLAERINSQPVAATLPSGE